MPGRALESVRVVEVGSGVSAAYAAKLCADLGADVIKVESPEGDQTRRAGPFPGNVTDPESSGLFLYLNSNKRGVALELDSAPDRATGEGQHIDLALWEASTALLPEAILERQMNGADPDRDGNRHPRMAPHGVFRCSGEDRWISITVGSEEEWQALCDTMGASSLADDPRFSTLADRKNHEDALEDRIEAWTRTAAPGDLTRRLQEAGVAAFPSCTNRDIAEDPHMNARGFFTDVVHPEVGARHHAGIPWRFSRTPCVADRPAPLFGQHTREVLVELGYSPAEIDLLEEAGVPR